MIKSLLFHTGRYFIMLASTVRRPSNIRMYWKEIVRQMYDIGVGSVTIVVLISVFIGAVSAVQFSYQIGGSFIPKYYIGYIVRDMTIIELAPTFTGLVLAGKVGSNMASEIGGMRQKGHFAGRKSKTCDVIQKEIVQFIWSNRAFGALRWRAGIAF